MHSVRIIFIGLCLLTNLTVGNQTIKRVILPQLHDETDARIGSHRAFVAFPAGALVDSREWQPENRLAAKLTESVAWDWYPLDGDEVTISLEPGTFQVDSSYDDTAVKLTPHCPQFTALSPDFAYGSDPAKVAAQIDLTTGTLFTQSMFKGMLAARLEAQAPGSVTITARSWRTGQTRSVTVSEGAGTIWIGNMMGDFFTPQADPENDDMPNMNHFLAYYRMAAAPNDCTWHPEPTNLTQTGQTAVASTAKTGAVRTASPSGSTSNPSFWRRLFHVRRKCPCRCQDHGGAPATADPGKNFGITCSPSNYP